MLLAPWAITARLGGVNGRFFGSRVPPFSRSPQRSAAPMTAKVRLSGLLTGLCIAFGIVACSAGEPPGEPIDNEPVPEVPSPAEMDHWSFKQAVVGEPPSSDTLSDPTWVVNGIDAFVMAGLDARGLAPSPRATPEVLVRRVTLALTGLPPTVEEVDAFVADPSDAAYEALVDRLLASRRHAEHMAVQWLDLARYADTDGFQYDLPRPAWQWRDWVLDALDRNLPYDQFTTQQLAGDLLPAPTPETIVATSFNRNHSIEGENGLVPGEFRDRYVSDRVETVGKVWLGMTIGCAKCHDHKFDPTTAKDFYRVYDCFNQTDEGDHGQNTQFRPTQELATPLQDDLVQQLQTRIAELEQEGQTQNAAELAHDLTAVQAVTPLRIMQDMPEKRPTQLLLRGQFDAPSGEPLQCSAPHFLPPFPTGAPPNRLGLAQWLMMPNHPLTHRVTVNRFWQQHFGAALVDSVDNFGLQTAAPIHLPLLDWLSQQWIASRWDMKAFHKLIVMSATYRQASTTDEATAALDPANTHLGRGPRFRLSAEVIRDIPLYVSGLLVERFGGPPAYPYQPPGLWEGLGWNEYNIRYPVMSGDSLYRRSVYTYWKRILPPPFLTIFDAPDRDLSSAARIPETSPQQALVMMNDPSMIQAARALSNRTLAAGLRDVDAAIASLFRAVTSRVPTLEEVAALRTVYDTQIEYTPSTDYGIPATDGTPEQVFALSQVARVVFNLNESLWLE